MTSRNPHAVVERGRDDRRIDMMRIAPVGTGRSPNRGSRWRLRKASAAAALSLAGLVAILPGGAASALLSPVFAYVTNSADGTVSIVNVAPSTPVVSATVTVGSGSASTPDGVAVSPDGSTVYVANYNDGTVSVIATGSNAVVATIPVGNQPSALAVTPSDARVYVVNSGSNSVSVISTATNTVTSTVAVGRNPTALTIGSLGFSANNVYVTNYDDGTLDVISDGVTPMLTATVNVGNGTVASADPASHPAGVAVGNAGNDVFVTDFGEGTVTEVATNGNATVGSPLLVGSGSASEPQGIATATVGADAGDAFVADFGDGTVSILNTTTTPPSAVGSPIRVGTGSSAPEGVALDPAGDAVFTATSGDNSMAEIATSTNSVEGSTATGNAPSAIAVADPSTSVTVLTAALPAATAGQPYSYTALATGGVGPYTWSDTGTPLPAWANLNPSTGVISGTPAVGTTSGIVLQATDANGDAPAASASLTLVANTVNVTTVSSDLPGGSLSVPYPATQLYATGGTPPYVNWTVSSGALPPGLALSAAGVVTGTPTGAGLATFTVTVQDSAGSPNTSPPQTLQINVAASAPTVTPAAFPSVVVGSSYPSQTIQATGGSGTYSFAVTAGTLPTGLTLTSNGMLSGSVFASGVYPFTVTATDGNGNTGSQAFSISVAATLAISTSSLPAGTLNTAYNATVGTSGGLAPLTFTLTAGALPPGLGLNGATGAITGTPTSTGPFGFTVQVVDSTTVPQVTSQALSITVGAAAPNVTTASPMPDGTLGTAYDQSLAASGGNPPYVAWAITAGALPPGLDLDAATGAITGTPTAAGTYPFTAQVTDSASQIGTKALSITILSDPSVTTAGLPSGALNVFYSKTLAAAGGTAPYTGWAITAGALPAGLSLNTTTGAITGTPTAPGTANFTVQVTDSATLTASKALSITVNGIPSVATPSLPDAVVGQSYSQTLDASGGTLPYTSWSVSAGSLPPGISLSTAGLVAGTPTASGVAIFTVQVTDAAGNSGSERLTLTVQPGSQGQGYWLTGGDGGVFSFGAAPFFGSTGSITLAKPIVGMTATPDGKGYWFVASDGGVFNYGDADFEGAVPSVASVSDIVGLAASRQGGYWVVGADGSIFGFGAPNLGAGLPGQGVHVHNIVGAAATPDGQGLYLVASDGGVYAFGDATFQGSMGGKPLNRPIVGMAVDTQTGGYWLVGTDGGVFSFNAPFFGSTGNITLNKPITGMTATPDGNGYWFVASDGGVFAEGDAQFLGSMGGKPLNRAIVGMAAG